MTAIVSLIQGNIQPIDVIEMTSENGSAYGFDFVSFTGNLFDYRFSESDIYTVTGAGEGTDTLKGIEQFRFADATVSVRVVGVTYTAVIV